MKAKKAAPFARKRMKSWRGWQLVEQDGSPYQNSQGDRKVLSAWIAKHAGRLGLRIARVEVREIAPRGKR